MTSQADIQSESAEGPESPLGWAVGALQRDADGHFLLGSAHAREIARRLEASSETSGEFTEHLHDLIGLAIVLRHEHASPSAADSIIMALAESPRAVIALEEEEERPRSLRGGRSNPRPDNFAHGDDDPNDRVSRCDSFAQDGRHDRASQKEPGDEPAAGVDARILAHERDRTTLAKFVGTPVARAPSGREPVPPGSVKATSFLVPGQTPRARKGIRGSR